MTMIATTAGCGASTPSPTPGSGDPCAAGGLGAWTGNDNVAASQDPPCGLAPEQVPMFVALGWDDNPDAEAMAWATRILEERGGVGSFYMTSSYGRSTDVQAAWRAARLAGHEIGNHTVKHNDGKKFTAAQWETEVTGCTEFLTSGGDGAVVPADQLVGFRTPYLGYNDATLGAVAKLGFHYDCSIEEGYQEEHDGTNYYWPYTLDSKSPGHTTQVEWGGPDAPAELTARPGLWELPVYALVVPPDDKCEAYGVPSGLRDRLRLVQTWFDPAGGKITGFDYNLWASKADGGFQMSKAETLATLKYSFDQRMAGNRAPFLLGVHSGYYIDEWNEFAPAAPTSTERREAIEEFLDYAKTKDGVRLASYRQVLDWMRSPKPL
jgi:peptidoglycan/xylan/chitin deacetylase (PgdA/CDA1 family)